MTPKEFEQIKQKIQNGKEDKLKCETKMDSILETLKKEFNVESIEEAKKLLNEKTIKLEELEEKKQQHESKLEALIGDFI